MDDILILAEVCTSSAAGVSSTSQTKPIEGIPVYTLILAMYSTFLIFFISPAASLSTADMPLAQPMQGLSTQQPCACKLPCKE